MYFKETENQSQRKNYIKVFLGVSIETKILCYHYQKCVKA